MQSKWTPVTKHNPCPVCGKPDFCAWTPDRAMLRCMRPGDPPQGMRLVKSDGDGGTLYAPIEARHNGNGRAHRASAPAPRPAAAAANLTALLENCRAKLTPDRMAALVDSTGLPATAWEKLAPGWCDAGDLRTLHASGAGWAESYPAGAWCFPEHDGAGRLVGLSLRAEDGRKGSPSGSTGARRGLIVPTNFHEGDGIKLAVEGASDAAACAALGIAAVGRPSNRAGAADLAELADGIELLIVGERDGKPGGAWPGRDGAKATARQVAVKLREPARWTLPPVGAKDMREWLTAKIAGGLDLQDAAAMKAAGAELLAVIEGGAKTVKPEKRSTADALVDLAAQTYRLGVTDAGEAFAVELAGPMVALMFRGGASALRAKLARAYRALTGKTPNAAALADALTALEGQALDATPEPVGLRLMPHGDGVAVDLGDAAGRAVVIGPDGWDGRDGSPVLFRRTALTGTLPEPADEHDPATLNELRQLLNVSDDSWPLIVGWLVAALFPTIPHPLLFFIAEQGTGKSTAARFLVGLVDPSPAMLRSEPRDPEQWAMAAAGSWCVVIDNLSHIAAWLADAFCKAVTGDGWIRRKLYTDSDLAVLAFRRCIVLTSIDPGAMRGDVGDRALLVDLQRIDDAHRRTEADLEALYAQARPRLLAGLYSAASRTLAALPGVKLDRLPRMADFARVLAALDTACPELTGGRALELFIGQRDRIAGDVVDSDAVGAAVARLMDERGEWSGTAAELLTLLTPRGHDGNPRPPRGWPASARGMAGHLRRVIPALRATGIDVDHARTPGGKRERTYTIRKTAAATVPTVPTVPSPGNSDDYSGTVGGTVDHATPELWPDRPDESPTNTGIRDGRDDRDGSIPPFSDLASDADGWGAEGEL